MRKKLLIAMLILVVILNGLLITLIVKKNIKSDTGIKYVFLFIGDGMGDSQVKLTEIYNSAKDGIWADGNYEQLTFSQFPTIGLRNTESLDYITDSAASATAMASGIRTFNGVINYDELGNEITPLTYSLKKKGWKIGIVTTDTLNGATPAAFYAKASDRYQFGTIANQLIESDFDFFAGGGITADDTLSYKGFINNAKKAGYTVIQKDEQIDEISNKTIIAPYEWAIDYAVNLPDEYFNLTSYVKLAIDNLYNNKGFFIVAENGNIDRAGHDNDLYGTFSEVNDLDNAVQVALEFASKHPKETLIIVTSDHETGGLSLGNNINPYVIDSSLLSKLSATKDTVYGKILAYNKGEISREEFKQFLTYSVSYNENFDYESICEAALNAIDEGECFNLADTVLKQLYDQSGISFSTTGHTASRVSVYAYGVSNERFAGSYDSPTFNKILRNLLGV